MNIFKATWKKLGYSIQVSKNNPTNFPRLKRNTFYFIVFQIMHDSKAFLSIIFFYLPYLKISFLVWMCMAFRCMRMKNSPAEVQAKSDASTKDARLTAANLSRHNEMEKQNLVRQHKEWRQKGSKGERSWKSSRSGRSKVNNNTSTSLFCFWSLWALICITKEKRVLHEVTLTEYYSQRNKTMLHSSLIAITWDCLLYSKIFQPRKHISS